MRIVVLGSGTGVGKTHVAVELARALRRLRPALPLVALKPIETGLADAARSDAARLAAALGSPPTPPRYGFVPPISPHRAAAEARVHIEIDDVLAWVEQHERPLRDATSHATTIATASFVSIIESAGGVFSPLSLSATNFDLARALEPALWLLVAPDALGVLHDLTVTLDALANRRRRPDHVVLSAARGADASTGTNARELEALGIVRPSAVLGFGQAAGLERLAAAILGDS